jgi:hypothetical protein
MNANHSHHCLTKLNKCKQPAPRVSSRPFAILGRGAKRVTVTKIKGHTFGYKAQYFFTNFVFLVGEVCSSTTKYHKNLCLGIQKQSNCFRYRGWACHHRWRRSHYVFQSSIHLQSTSKPANWFRNRPPEKPPVPERKPVDKFSVPLQGFTKGSS